MDTFTASPRYAIYARSATKVARQTSIADQIETCSAAAAEINPQLTVPEDCVFIDQGVAGTAFHGRAGLTALMQMALEQPRSFDHVFVADTARLSRNMADGLRVIEFLTHHSVEVHFVSLRLCSSDPNFHLIIRRRRNVRPTIRSCAGFQHSSWLAGKSNERLLNGQSSLWLHQLRREPRPPDWIAPACSGGAGRDSPTHL